MSDRVLSGGLENSFFKTTAGSTPKPFPTFQTLPIIRVNLSILTLVVGCTSKRFTGLRSPTRALTGPGVEQLGLVYRLECGRDTVGAGRAWFLLPRDEPRLI